MEPILGVDRGPRETQESRRQGSRAGLGVGNRRRHPTNQQGYKTIHYQKQNKEIKKANNFASRLAQLNGEKLHILTTSNLSEIEKSNDPVEKRAQSCTLSLSYFPLRRSEEFTMAISDRLELTGWAANNKSLFSIADRQRNGRRHWSRRRLTAALVAI